MAGTAGGIRAGKAYVELGASDELSAGLAKAQRQIRAFGAGIRAAGIGLAAVSSGIAAPAIVATRTYANFERAMSRVKALTNATEGEFEALTNKARRLGIDTVFTATDAANAMSVFALAGYKTGDIMRATGPTLDLAAAGMMDIAEAADISVKVMAGMGIGTEKLGYAIDVLTKAMTTSNTDLRMLGDAMKYVGPVAKAAGISFEETTAAIQLLSNAGIQADMAGTTLRGALLSLTDPSKEAADKLAEIGVAVMDAKGNTRDLASIIDDMNKGLAGMGKGAKLGVIGRIFDARQAAGFAELLSQGGSKLRAYTQALQGAGGTAARIAATQLDNLSGDAFMLTSSLEEVQHVVGKALTPSLRGVAQWLTRVTNATTGWAKAHSDLIPKIGLITVGIGAVGVAMVGLSVAAVAVSKAFTMIGTVGSLASTVFRLVATAIAAVVSPIGLVIAAAVSLGAVVLYASGAAGKAVQWLGERFVSLLGTVSSVDEGITAALSSGDVAQAAKVLWAGLKLAWEEGSAALSKIWAVGKSWFITAFHDMWYGGLQVANNAYYYLQVGWIETTSFLRSTWQQFTSWLSTEWDTIVNLASKAWNEIRGVFVEDFDTAAANAAADKVLTDKLEAIDSEKAAAIAEIEKSRQQRRTGVDEGFAAEQRRVAEADQKASNDLAAKTAAALGGAQGDLAKAKAELAAAIAKANKKKPVALDKEGASAVDKFRDAAKAIQDKLAAAGKAIKVSVVGTFSGARAEGLGAGRGNRIADATERTARGVERLRRDVADRGLVWA